MSRVERLIADSVGHLESRDGANILAAGTNLVGLRERGRPRPSARIYTADQAMSDTALPSMKAL